MSKRSHVSSVAVLAFACALAACAAPRIGSPGPAAEQPVGPAAPIAPPQPVAEPTGRVEILWDAWGIPHIFAKDEVALLWAFGFAQMQSHGDLVLRLYGQARGRAAEYWGEDHVESDRWVRVNGIPARARDWVDGQDPYIRAYLDAFVAGINAYAAAYPDSIGEAVRMVLPVTSADVLAHTQRVIHYAFVASVAGVEDVIDAWRRGGGPGDDGALDGFASGSMARNAEPAAGSNAWAIAPARTASGNAMLLANPHLPWGDLFTWYETQLVGPGLDVYGAALVGFPLPGIAFNEHLGWTHTVNTIDAADLYELRLAEGGYVWDGGTRAFETATDTLRVRQPDGSLRHEPFVVRQSVHGPVVAERNGRALALRVAGVDRPHILEQTWRMLRARSLSEFEAALAQLQIPMFNVMYADRDGRILFVHNGAVPKRPGGDWQRWAGIVPGESSSTLWATIHDYAELPRVLDPRSGWLQNANDPPWTTTFPQPLRPADFAPYMAPVRSLAFRPQRSVRMLATDSTMSFDEMVAYKHSTRVESADHILEDLIVAARASGNDNAIRAARVLETWDRETDADSRGAVLYEAFWRELQRHRWPRGPFDVPWRSDAPLSTPDGLADPAAAANLLDAAAARVARTYGAIDVAWGDVYRLRRDGIDLPASGGPGGMGVFRVIGFEESPDGRGIATSGDSFVAVIEFGPTLRAAALLSYGNASRIGSPHRTDQLPLLARNQLRPVWRTRAEIEANLEKRVVY